MCNIFCCLLPPPASRESSPIRAPQKIKPYQNGVENGYALTNGHHKENGYSTHNGHSHINEHSDDEYIDTVEVMKLVIMHTSKSKLSSNQCRRICMKSSFLWITQCDFIEIFLDWFHWICYIHYIFIWEDTLLRTSINIFFSLLLFI